MCCSGAKWKREDVPDHKFDFIDVVEFRDTGCFTRARYILLYILFVKSFLVYISDLYTVIILLASDKWNNTILAANADSKVIKIPFLVGKWIFFGCIVMSFLLLLWEARKARAIIRSRDISYAFTNVMANNHYSLKSYNHFSFFCQINNSKKTKDDIAFFVFFTFKGWKRLILADAPRQVINGLTLYSFGSAMNWTTDVNKYVNGSWVTGTVLVSMIFTVVVWAGSAVLLLIAAFMYVPLLCYIQGNLKEYCCHKIDKRIAEMMKKKTRKRLLQEAARARKEAAGDYSHLKDKKGNIKQKPLAQPTLPKVDMYDDESRFKRDYSSSDVSLRKDPSYYNSTPGHAYPPKSGWGSGQDGPAPLPYAYEGSEVGGYAGSVHSMDRLVQTPGPMDNDPYGPYSGKAPSYHSQVSLNDTKGRPWDDPSPPPVPTYSAPHDSHPQYFQDQVETPQQQSRTLSPGPNDYGQQHQWNGNQQHVQHNQYDEEYQPISRRQLFEQTSHDRQPRHGSAYSGANFQQQEERPDSAYDLGDYYSDQPRDWSQQQAPYRR